MLTLEQAIALATKAHEGQWRKSQNLDEETAKLFMCMEEELYPTILSNGNKVFIKNETFVMQKPYITHPLDVMKMMDTEEEKIVAVLHDVIESTSAKLEIVFGGKNSTITYNSIVYELPLTIALALHKLTHTNEEAYMNYIQKVSTGKLATKVKLADIVCNLADSPSEHAKQKYIKALPILLKTL